MSEGRADTAPSIGRTYAIPFEPVWQAALALAQGGLRGWRLVSADDVAGAIEAVVSPMLFAPASRVEVRISLDPDGQTRVEARAASAEGRRDLGANARRLSRFFKALERSLADIHGESAGATGRPA